MLARLLSGTKPGDLVRASFYYSIETEKAQRRGIAGSKRSQSWALPSVIDHLGVAALHPLAPQALTVSGGWRHDGWYHRACWVANLLARHRKASHPPRRKNDCVNTGPILSQNPAD